MLRFGRDTRADESSGFDLLSGHLHTRRYTAKLLQELAKFYEFVVFTADAAEFALEVVQELHPQRHMISHVLSREWTQVDYEDNSVKDLSTLGRPLSTVLLVDSW